MIPIRGREEADSQRIRDKCWEWYLSDARTRLKPGGAIVLTMTRWHEDDLAGRILPEGYSGESGTITARDGEEWEVVCFPAEAETHDLLGRKPGEFLWPEWFRPHELEQTKITAGPRAWSALYQQRPSPETGLYFKREWIRYYDNPPPLVLFLHWVDYVGKWGHTPLRVGIMGVVIFLYSSSDWSVMCVTLGDPQSVAVVRV